MKRTATTILLLTVVASLWAQDLKPFGMVNYVEGTVTVIRAGKPLKEALNIGDDVFPDDMLKTTADSYVVIDLAKTTGMAGTLTIKPKSVVYLRLSPDATSPKSTIELISGQIGSKLAKISGSPTFKVTTDGAVMGVRGTGFTVATSVSGGILVVCSEGAVTAEDESGAIAVPAGKAAEKRPAERLRLMPVSVSSPEEFEKRWIAEAIEAFRADPARALADYEKRYADLSARFAAAFDPIQKSEILSKWLKEDASGTAINPRSPEVMREKKELAGAILEVRKVLFIFERIYYRILQLQDIVAGTPAERIEIRKGLTVGDFLRKVKSEAAVLERRVNLFRQAERLYALRNADGTGFSGLGGSGGEDDFFGSSGDWDF